MIFDPQGLAICARYSFAPNLLHYCGPEKQTDMRAYVSDHVVDQGLYEILNRFDTLYKYLKMIGIENDIRDPFDPRVVEAYWLGNDLLHKTKYRPLADLLNDGLQLKKKLTPRHLNSTLSKLDQGVAHHTFHVLNIFRRTGHHAVPHTLSTMDSCRISWGKIMGENNAPRPPLKKRGQGRVVYLIEVRSLMYKNNHLQLGLPQVKQVKSVGLIPKVGEWVSVHWGYVCEVLMLRQVRNLKYFTELAIRLANRS